MDGGPAVPQRSTCSNMRVEPSKQVMLTRSCSSLAIASQPGSFSRLVDEYNVATRDHLATIPTAGPNAIFAMLTRRHMRQHKLSRAVYGGIAVAQRAWAAGNPKRRTGRHSTLDEYLRAPMVADPLGRYDCVPVVAGAAPSSSTRSAGGRGVRVRALSPVTGWLTKRTTAFAQGSPNSVIALGSGRAHPRRGGRRLGLRRLPGHGARSAGRPRLRPGRRHGGARSADRRP